MDKDGIKNNKAKYLSFIKKQKMLCLTGKLWLGDRIIRQKSSETYGYVI